MYEKLKNPGTRVILRLLEETRGKDGLKIVQRALNRMGKHLVVDGIIGPITTAAIKSVNNRKLHREIEKLLYPETSQSSSSHSHNEGEEPSWLKIAHEELGVKEIHGWRDNPRILQYHSAAGGAGWKDEVPWCASFVAFVMRKAGYKPPKYPARALSWLKFGKSSFVPVLGAIAVKKRKGGGHVCFVVGKSADGKYIYCLGGNQNDEVNIKRYPVRVFVDFRIPKDYEPKAPLPIMHGKSGPGRES